MKIYFTLININRLYVYITCNIKKIILKLLLLFIRKVKKSKGANYFTCLNDSRNFESKSKCFNYEFAIEIVREHSKVTLWVNASCLLLTLPK